MENSSLNNPESGQVNLNSNVELEPILGEIVPQILSNELSEEEEKERLRLERQVERAFYQAGIALFQLRSRRLYRNEFNSFSEYTQARFNFGRQTANRLIAAAKVYDNLVPNGHLILPVNERQVRPITALNAEEQNQVWQSAIEKAKGVAPSGRLVKEIAQKMYPTQPSKKPEIAHHLKLQPRGLVEINTPHLVDLHQRYGRIYLVHKSTVEIWARNIESMTMNLHKLKHSEVEPVPFEREPQLMSVRSRLEKLFKLGLDPLDREILMLLERPVAFTPREMECLEAIEARYSN
ncbi:MAG: hypothetical protein QNJ54_31435 [Prochloraceae cyanobacterium]|nr:hypothetical protein [Prochloraceae cyanobacterium]